MERRLRELAPLVEEYRELEAVAKRLGIAPTEGRLSTGRPHGARRQQSSASSAAAARRRPSKRRDQVVDRLSKGAGLTVRELADELQVGATALYPAIRQLEADGIVAKRGHTLELVAPPTEPTANDR